jgi:nucleotide-binding universal stress UspA family protein
VVEVDRQDESLLARGTDTFALRRIVLPVDFSECSRKALHYAVPLARQFHASLLLVYVMPVHYYVGSEFGPVDVPMPEEQWLQNAQEQLARLAEQEIGGQVATRCLVLRGQPVHEIVRAARDEQADLILLSTHGHTGLKHVLLGSVAENVVRYSPCPVLVVRDTSLQSPPLPGPRA